MKGRHDCQRSVCRLLAFALACVAGTAMATQPNVVFILIDDLSHYGVTAYGANRISERSGAFENVRFSTPNVDRLAADGLRCNNAFAYPLCEPSRVALMTGQYNSRNFLKPKSLHASQITISDVFQRAGYATGIFGKWKQTRGTRDIPAKDYLREFGWDEFVCFDVTDQGLRYIDPLLVENGKVINYKKQNEPIDPATGRRWYGPDICSRHTVDFIDRHRDEPFFLYYPMMLVHDEHTPTPDTSPKEAYDTFPAINCWNRDCPGDDRRYLPDMIAYTDKLIGRVVDKLDALGLREQTLIVVMGDNGTKEPFSHILPDGTEYPGGKGGNRDNGMHVPLIVSWPGKVVASTPEPSDDSGYRTYDGLIDIVDLYPTLLEAAGIAIPQAETIDGISFWAQAIGASSEEHRNHINTWYNANHAITDLSEVLRYAFNKEFKRYAPHASFPDGRFFDLRSDPLELAGDRQVTIDFGHIHREGLDVDQLDAEQRAAYDELGAIIDASAYVSVDSMTIASDTPDLAVGGTAQLSASTTPQNATRPGIVWATDNSSVATIDKFGVLTAHSSGSVEVVAYSWDDAYPLAAGDTPTYSTAGVSASLSLDVAAAQ